MHATPLPPRTRDRGGSKEYAKSCLKPPKPSTRRENLPPPGRIEKKFPSGRLCEHFFDRFSARTGRCRFYCRCLPRRGFGRGGVCEFRVHSVRAVQENLGSRDCVERACIPTRLQTSLSAFAKWHFRRARTRHPLRAAAHTTNALEEPVCAILGWPESGPGETISRRELASKVATWDVLAILTSTCENLRFNATRARCRRAAATRPAYRLTPLVRARLGHPAPGSREQSRARQIAVKTALQRDV